MKGRKVRFSAEAPPALPAPEQVPLLDGHGRDGDGKQVGRVVRFEERADGLHAVFAVSAEAVELVASGKRARLSAGVFVTEWERHRGDGIDVQRAVVSDLRHVALTDDPAFPAAEVQSASFSMVADDYEVVATGNPAPFGPQDYAVHARPKPQPAPEPFVPAANITEHKAGLAPLSMAQVEREQAAARAAYAREHHDVDRLLAEVREEAQAAVLRSVVGGCRVEPPVRYGEQRRVIFESEVAAIRERRRQEAVRRERQAMQDRARARAAEATDAI